MLHEILYCHNCKAFTIKKACSKCSQLTSTLKPAKYSLEDKFGRYRRMAKNVQKI